MKRIRILLACLLLLSSTFAVVAQEVEHVVEISTTKGVIKVKLYNDTPIHRDFFLSQVRKGYFNRSLFGRVIPGFVIQGGSEDSKDAPPGTLVGHGRSAMLLPPETRMHHFPKKGALAMPRQPIDVNPEQKSDGSQFFIVQGIVYTDEQIKALEYQKNGATKKRAFAKFYTPYKAEFDSLRAANPKEFNRRVDEFNHRVDSMIRRNPDHLLFPPEEKEAYTTLGGSPHLRGEYTIFGEVIEGFEVIDIIANMPSDRNNRPYEDVVMTVRVLK